MGVIKTEVSSLIDAAPAAVYAVLSDYKVGHPAIVPKPYFTAVEVVEGGVGAGTKIIVRMKAFGKEYVYNQIVTEPEPGRVLVEEDAEQGTKSTFTVNPHTNPNQCHVTICVESRGADGVMGAIQKWMNTSFTKKILTAELKQLNDYMQTQKA